MALALALKVLLRDFITFIYTVHEMEPFLNFVDILSAAAERNWNRNSRFWQVLFTWKMKKDNNKEQRHKHQVQGVVRRTRSFSWVRPSLHSSLNASYEIIRYLTPFGLILDACLRELLVCSCTFYRRTQLKAQRNGDGDMKIDLSWTNIETEL